MVINRDFFALGNVSQRDNALDASEPRVVKVVKLTIWPEAVADLIFGRKS